MSIQVQHLSLPYLTTNTNSAIWGQDLSFSTALHYLIQAPSGSGKSSFFDCLCGRKEHNGTIILEGQKIDPKQDLSGILKEDLSLVFQDLNLFEELSALDNVLVKNQLTNHLFEEHIHSLFDLFGLFAVKHNKCSHLSFGEQQRVAIIRAFCQPFKWLIMDEPFSHLDKEWIEVISKEIETQVTKRNAGLIMLSLGEDYGMRWDKTLQL